MGKKITYGKGINEQDKKAVEFVIENHPEWIHEKLDVDKLLNRK